MECVEDGQGGEDSDCADQVGRTNVMMASRSEQIFYIRYPVIFAAGTLGRLPFEIGVVHEFVDQCGRDAARLREAGVFVKTLAAATEMLN